MLPKPPSLAHSFFFANPLSLPHSEYVFILSSLQPHVDMARLCRQVQQRHSKLLLQLATQSSPQHLHHLQTDSRQTIALALSCMNQYELRRACHEWKAIIVHIDPDCTALQRSVALHYNQYHLWAAVKAVLWGGLLAVVGTRQKRIVNNSRWPSSRWASVCVMALGALFTASCISKTLEFMKAIPRGYDVVKIRNTEHEKDHLFLVRRDFMLRSNPRILPMYLLSGLGIGTMLVGARIAFKIRRS